MEVFDPDKDCWEGYGVTSYSTQIEEILGDDPLTEDWPEGDYLLTVITSVSLWQLPEGDAPLTQA